MQIDLSGKVALVTGGSRGIGRAIALGLARAGADVTLSYASNASAADAVVAEITAAGGKAAAVGFDVADSAACKAQVDALAKQKGLHILVANAGISIDGLVMRYKDEDLERTFRTNVFGSYYLARAAIMPMIKARWGRIILLGSVVGEAGNAGQTAYAASKAALDGLGKSLAREVASRNITANVVAPGYIESDMTNGLPEAVRDAIKKSIPLGEVGKPEDIADSVVFLASDRARYITGQVIGVNGGMYM